MCTRFICFCTGGIIMERSWYPVAHIKEGML
uniref:Uncharacterized protein n=1 Tax=Arundo donax TaxID=35708 RepID=A0A0A9DSF6_ARUDO